MIFFTVRDVKVKNQNVFVLYWYILNKLPKYRFVKWRRNTEIWDFDILVDYW